MNKFMLIHLKIRQNGTFSKKEKSNLTWEIEKPAGSTKNNGVQENYNIR